VRIADEHGLSVAGCNSMNDDRRPSVATHVFMNENTIIEYIRESLDGVDVVVASREAGAPEVAWGDTFFIYDPDRRLKGSQRFPFATIVTKDYGDFDRASQLNRPGVFRLNFHVSRSTFDSMFAEGRVQETARVGGSYDFAALDTLLPHPVYAAQRWVCVLNPSVDKFRNVVRPLPTEAHGIARARYRKRVE
jgi:Family of unknown function (DUF6194)